MVEEKDTERVDEEIVEEVVESIQEDNQEQETVQEETKSQGKDVGSANDGDSGDGDSEYVKHVQDWRALREKTERAERERDEAIKMLQQQQNAVYQQQPESKEFNVGDDDLIEGKHLKHQKQDIDQRFAQLEERLIEAHIKTKYPDFDDVVTPETLGMLRDTDPELAESIAANPNIQSKAIAVYKSIKRCGLAKPTSYDRSKEKVNNNFTKPRTVTSISPQQGDSPLSRANAFAEGLTDDVKAQVWKEMQEIMKNG